MAGFNFSPFKSNTSSQNYSYLISQLDIKQNQLASDGKLSPGDYDLLTKMAKDAYKNPGLTPQQRNDVLVKISSYEKDKSTNALSDSANLTNLNGEVSDSFNKNSMLFGNNPKSFLQANSDTLRLKLDQLSQTIDQMDNSGADSAVHMNEYTKTLKEFQDAQAALSDVSNYKGGPSASNFGAYITTNSKGEVSDVKIGRIGSQTGYQETSGIYGGLPLYGKVNYKQNDKNVFKIGGNTFSAADYLIPGPDGTMKPNVLVDENSQQGNANYKTGASTPTPIDLGKVSTMTALQPGEWAKGPSGAYYKKSTDGSYQKYVNVDPAKVGIDPGHVLNVPKSFEGSVLSPFAKQTVDGSAPVSAPLPPSPAPAAGPPAPSSTPPTTQTPPQANARTQAPTQRAPGDIRGLGTQAINSAKSFLGGLFGSGGK